ncbi:carbohydrate esterase family 3 protein [Apiospora kogelbergensis]|uniref:Carbohydrate esterase family 3 protein n=1 Tax=Apiospora kogelbergensis TaxID=1337665 RepID=A0AAW0QGG3_9PEZI
MAKDGAKSSGGRFGFLRTKRVLATLSLLLVVAIILIGLFLSRLETDDTSLHGLRKALGATGVFAGHHDDKAAAVGEFLGPIASLNPETGTDLTPVAAAKPKPTSAADRRQFPGSIANGTALRIMPLGASSVRGENSPGNTGFRKPLRDALVALNVSVNMVGSQKVGDFPDNDVEAYLGVRVSQLHERSRPAVKKYKPNVFIINAGINNALMNYELDTAGKDMESYIRDLLAMSPRAAFVLSTLTPSRIPHCEPLILDINKQYWDLYNRLKAESLPIVVADVHYSGQEPDALQLSDITDDGTHPTHDGYLQMARIYTKAVQHTDSLDFLQVPEPLAGVPDDGAAPKGGAGSTSKTVRHSAAHEQRRRFLHMKRELCITSNPNLWGK